MQRLTLHLGQIENDRICLTPAQVHYLRQVLRLRSGDPFLSLHPQGGVWLTLLGDRPSVATLQEPWLDLPELRIQATLLIALPKTGFDEVVRQCVELGAKTIVPVISERTLLQPSESKQKRWQRIAQEAAEQCERNTVPIVSPVLPLIPALAQVSPEDDRYICVTRIAAVSFLTRILSPDPPAKNQLAQNRSIAIVTGPEGGWTSAEVTAAIDLGYEPVSLGNLILRAVTAPIAVMSLVMAASSTTPTFPSCSERSELPSA